MSTPGAAQAERVRTRARALAPPLLLLLILVGFYWKITLTRQYNWMDSPDLAYQVLPWYQFQAREWRQGHIPLWDPYEWGGQPLLAQAQPGAAYPPNWLLFWMPMRHGRIRPAFLTWYFVLIHYMAALLAYWLCRDLGRSRTASLLAATAFAVAGWIGSIDWPQMVNGALWTPAVFLFLLRTARGDRPRASAALAGAMLGISLLSGHHQIPIFVGLACAGVWIWLLAREGRWNGTLVGALALFGLFAFLTGAFQTLPAYEYGKLALRWVSGPAPVTWRQPVPYSVHASFGLGPLSVLGLIIPGLSGHVNTYLGAVVILLACLGVAAWWRETAVRVLLVVALGGLLYSLAGYSVFQGLLYALVPEVDKARNPAMAFFIFNFGFMILSAYGIDGLFISIDKLQSALRMAARILAGMAGTIYIVLLIYSLGQFPKALDHQLVAAAALSSLLLAGVVSAWRHSQIGPRALVGSLAVLLLFEAGLTGSPFGWLRRDEPASLFNKLSQHQDVVQYIRSVPVPVRLEVDDQAIPYNLGDWEGIDVLGAYLASLTVNVHRVQANFNARMLYGVNFFVGDKPRRPDQVLVYSAADGLKVYANPAAQPRVWTVHEVESIRRDEDAAGHLERPLNELRRHTFLVGSVPHLDTCAALDHTALLRRDSNRVEIQADMACGGMVVLGETAFPGWQASVDGRPVRVYEPYTFLRGVVVPAGRHRIEMRYRPRSVLWGGSLTAAGLLAALCIAWFHRRQPAA